jgi:hypothetical protein
LLHFRHFCEKRGDARRRIPRGGAFQVEQMPQARSRFPQGLVGGIQGGEASRCARQIGVMPGSQSVELVFQFLGIQPRPARFLEQRKEILRSFDGGFF